MRQLSSFVRFVNSNLARKIGKHYGWRRKFFGRRYRAIQVSDEEAAQIDRLRYLLAQGVKEQLVRSPLDWPGVHCAWPLANGKLQLDGWWDDQTAAYRARIRGEKTKRNEFRETETLTLSPLPCWQHRSQEAIRNDVRALIEDLEAEAKASGRPVLGVRKTLSSADTSTFIWHLSGGETPRRRSVPLSRVRTAIALVPSSHACWQTSSG